MPIRVLILCRISSTKQQFGQSLEEQENKAVNLALGQGYRQDEIKVFIEVYTGTKDHRPDFESMMVFAERHASTIEKVIVADIDRFTRAGVSFYEQTKGRLARLGIALVDLHGIIQPERNYLEGIGEGFGKDYQYEWSVFSPSEGEEILRAQQAKSERRKILLRTIPKQIENIKNGYEARPASYGFCNDKIIEPKTGQRRAIRRINSDEAKYIRRMYELKREGRTNRKICEVLNQEGFLTRAKNAWLRNRNGKRICIQGKIGRNPLKINQVNRYLSHVSYAGFKSEKWTWGKLIKAKHEPIVSIKMWNEANKGKWFILKGSKEYRLIDLTKEKRKFSNENPDFPLKSLIHCPLCHCKVKAAFSRSKSGKRYPFYFCNRKHPQTSINANELTVILKEELAQKRFTKEQIVFLESGIRLLWKQKFGSKEALAKSREKKIKTLQQEASRLAANIGQLSIPELILETEKQYQIIKDKIALLKVKNKKKAQPSDELLEQLLAYCKKIVEHPVEVIFSPDNKTDLPIYWKMIFDKPVTLENIRCRTLSFSRLMRPNEWSAVSKASMACHRSLESNTFNKELERWIKLLI